MKVLLNRVFRNINQLIRIAFPYIDSLYEKKIDLQQHPQQGPNSTTAQQLFI
jgi:hypothetical protein